MPLTQLKIFTTAQNADAISDFLTEQGALSVTLADAADQPIYEPDLGSVILWQQTCVISLFDETATIKKLMTQLKAIISDFSYQTEILENQNWVELTQKNFPPIRVGKKLWICPAWEKINVTVKVVLLNPGLAFGTGTHPTTSLCLEWLEQNIKGKELVIDYGCGSGILAVAALKLGVKQVWAIDHDSQALEATSANSRLNDLSGNELITATPNQTPPWQADLVIANILAEPLIQLVPTFIRLLKPQGKVILSGILEEQAKAVMAAYQPYFAMSPPIIKEGWILLQGKRRLFRQKEKLPLE